MKAEKLDMNVSALSADEARAIVLSLRTVLSFELSPALPADYLHDIAYLRDRGTKAFLEALRTP